MKTPYEKVLQEIQSERRRQMSFEGWTIEHDDTHEFGELARAASVYCLGKLYRYFNGYMTGVGFEDVPRLTEAWPWRQAPKLKSHRENLIRAGALIVAEIERLDRKSKKEKK